MKLSGVYVYLDKEYRRIESVEWDEKALGKSPNSIMAKFKVPEDCLPYVLFDLGNHRLVGFNDFELKYPFDSYVLSPRLKAYFGVRRMSRQYKLGPSSDNLQIHPPGVNIKSFLNALDTTKLSKPSEILDFDKERDYVFSSNIAAKQVSRWSRSLLYCDKKIFTVKRGQDCITVNKVVANKYIPTIISNMFSDILAKKVHKATPLPDDMFKPKDDIDSNYIFDGDNRNTHYSWREYGTSSVLRGKTHRCFKWAKGIDGETTGVLINTGSGDVHRISSMQDTVGTYFRGSTLGDIEIMLHTAGLI